LNLFWKKLHPNAQAPAVAHPGEDLGYDLYCAEPATLHPGRVTLVRTGIAIQFDPAHGALVRDRSSMATKGIKTSGGVIDAGYRGEIFVPMTLDVNSPSSKEEAAASAYVIQAGDKIAQMIPVKPLTIFQVEEKESLTDSARGEKRFGSSGR
jgi:dUTP pyrophosphatase